MVIFIKYPSGFFIFIGCEELAVIAKKSVCDLFTFISYFRLSVWTKVAYKNHARIQLYEALAFM